ncbi:MAG: exodeoxyribonuclease VII large subunit [Planctomycetes bacterium]|nr:exodeoxyribonuclease VII large subunit [Planctomycetota bacterium]
MKGRQGVHTDPFDWEPRDDPPPSPAIKLFQVSELTRAIKTQLEDLGRVAVEGEVTRVTSAASGHTYFDLKDMDSKIACTVWRSQAAALARVPLKEGTKVVAHGKLDVYAPRGTYSLNVTKLELAGLGALLAQLEELKAKLKAQGWFDRARPLPELPRVIGVVTSRDGAAFQDFLRTRSVRWPLYPVRLAHTSVQGPTAAREIGAAIARLDASGVDVIVVCRGGGSLEDLWAFNELPVLEAVHACSVPVVSGVGHETDTTLCDLVSDLRAHTPTDAAQTVIPERAVFVDALERARNDLGRAIDSVLIARKHRLERVAASSFLRDPRWILASRDEKLKGLARALRGVIDARLGRAASRIDSASARVARQSPALVLERAVARVEAFGPRLRVAVRQAFERRTRKLDLVERSLSATSPLAVLGRGYSITARASGGPPVRDAAQLSAGEALVTRLASGSVVSKVERTDVRSE